MECYNGFVSAEEELRRARLENETLMIAWSEYEARLRNLERKLEKG